MVSALSFQTRVRELFRVAHSTRLEPSEAIILDSEVKSLMATTSCSYLGFIDNDPVFWRELFSMRKSTIIGQCLVNSKMFQSIEEAEHAVAVVFADEFPNRNYSNWNHNIDTAVATHIINSVGCASRINVKKFIEDLS